MPQAGPCGGWRVLPLGELGTSRLEKLVTVQELRDAGSAPGPAAPRAFAARMQVAGSQSSPRAAGSRIGPFRTALCYRVIYGTHQRGSRGAESPRAPS